MSPNNADPFDDLLTLEDTLYTTAHSQGVSDGARAGRIEGRVFGLEKGFEKFAELGSLHGRGALPVIQNPSTRLLSNTSLLYHLTDPSTFSTANTEASVADFDDRVKRAGAKAKVVERIVGENSAQDSRSPERGAGKGGKGKSIRLEGEAPKRGKKGDDNMEDFMGSRLIG
ncbi:hypothetical protein N0V86_005971 [Didymella sp. IMI 355093]|nr:hypothetical protein N0V86_005971 [Didymella sp. IMI 355093]